MGLDRFLELDLPTVLTSIEPEKQPSKLHEKSMEKRLLTQQNATLSYSPPGDSIPKCGWHGFGSPWEPSHIHTWTDIPSLLLQGEFWIILHSNQVKILPYSQKKINILPNIDNIKRASNNTSTETYKEEEREIRTWYPRDINSSW